MYNNGFLNLNYLFENFYFLTKEDNFFSQPYVELEVIGKRKKFWFTVNNNGKTFKYLYKKDDSKKLYESYGEILAKEIAIILNIPCADYMLASFDYENNNIHDFKKSYGTITPNFLKENEYLVPMGEIISSVYDNIIVSNKELKDLFNPNNIDRDTIINSFNNLEDIWSIFDLYFKNYPNKTEIVQTLMEHFVKVYLFDIITIQGDRHIWNSGIIINKKTKAARPAPIYDNSNILNLNKSKIETFLNICNPNLKNMNAKKLAIQKEMSYNMLYHSKLLFSANASDFLSDRHFDKKAKHLDSLKVFLDKSDKSIIQLLENYVSTLNNIGPHKIISNYEKNANYTFPEDFKDYFITSLQMNLDNIVELISKPIYRR